MDVCTAGACNECDACTTDAPGDPLFATPVAQRLAETTVRERRGGTCTQIGLRKMHPKRARVVVPGDAARDEVRAFIALVAKMDAAPWANLVFDVNDRMLRCLTATHMHLIVGRSLFKTCDRQSLLRLIEPSTSLDGYANVIWVTNRQQGKTSTLAKFIASLAVHSGVGGHLCNIYSTNLDRANELARAAKQFVEWIPSVSAQHAHVRITTNNSTTFVVDNGRALNKVVARPKNPNSCRGDAPESCFFDEVGFVGEQFWYKFAYPLLQVSQRVATCTTTPPPTDGFFQAFIDNVKQQNKSGDMFFVLFNHTLSCATCIDSGEAERCCHRLEYIPPWKSLMRFSSMGKLVPAKQRDTFRAEVYGVIGARTNTYFPPKLVDAAVERARHAYVGGGTSCVWVGIDPASHSVSDMAMVAVTFVQGMTVVVGLANVNVARSDVAAVIAYVKVFLRRLRSRIGAMAPLVPIVEVNSSEIFATSITRAFKEFAPVYMPFDKATFTTCVLEHVGVRTTSDTKCMMVTHLYQCLCEGRLVFAERLAHVSAVDIALNAVGVSAESHVRELGEQLKRFADTEKGDISGKTNSGDNDDLGMALMLAIYWATVVKLAKQGCE